MKAIPPETERAAEQESNREPRQADLILARLQQTPGEWVPMPELYRCSGAYAVHSRISELRDDGHRIECRIRGARPRCSMYRLIADAVQVIAAVVVALAVVGCRLPTFGNEAPDDVRNVRPGGNGDIYIFRNGHWEEMKR